MFCALDPNASMESVNCVGAPCVEFGIFILQCAIPDPSLLRGVVGSDLLIVVCNPWRCNVSWICNLQPVESEKYLNVCLIYFVTLRN